MNVAHDFRRRWWLANSVSVGVGLVAFSLLGHGITGAHGDELTATQYAAHTVGFLAASVLVLIAQRKALGSLRKVSAIRIAIGICAALALVITWDTTLSPDPSSLLDHTTGWLIVGTATGVVGGYLSARALARLLLGAGEAVTKS